MLYVVKDTQKDSGLTKSVQVCELDWFSLGQSNTVNEKNLFCMFWGTGTSKFDFFNKRSKISVGV